MFDSTQCLLGDFPIEDYPHIFTQRILQIIEQINCLVPNRELYINVMKDEHLKKESAGASVTVYINKDIINLDPMRITEYAVAHELMHITLHCSGWPQMKHLIENDMLANRISSTIDNALDQYIFNPKLEQIGVDVLSYKEAFIEGYLKWPANESTSNENILRDALKIFESLLFGKTYRDIIINTLKNKHPTSLGLARQILKRASSLQSCSKQGVRQSMVLILDFINRWLSERSGQQQKLRDRVGITPLFATKDLEQPAISSIYYKTLFVKENKLWLLTFGLKKDNINFVTFHANIGSSDFQPIINNYELLSVKEFLDSETIPYGLID